MKEKLENQLIVLEKMYPLIQSAAVPLRHATRLERNGEILSIIQQLEMQAAAVAERMSGIRIRLGQNGQEA